MRFGSTAKVLLKCKLKYYRISEWDAAQVEAARRRELEALATRKYMDACCVYFWATTSLLFTLLTFGMFTLLGHPLTPSAVFTSLALFNVLIAPLNSFPWVINGAVEGLVSVRRLEAFLMAGETDGSWWHGGGC